MATAKFLAAVCMVRLTLTAIAAAFDSPEVYVASHNDVRAEYGVGPVTWNQTLASYAQVSANSAITTCEMRQSSSGPYGQNYLVEPETAITEELAVTYWASESEFYDYSSKKCVGGECGHFKAVVWRDTESIGCAMANCKKYMLFITCNYYPPVGVFTGRGLCTAVAMGASGQKSTENLMQLKLMNEFKIVHQHYRQD
ncbi:pathogenesis-related leaf protein 4-like [Momordica charantia]|uniref:Pathogenesis-related leaf protein 4-like n=1 Tax=Momordica charantia TaxID=3673 RepID=A0A6J1D4Y0_MOMCH|nr:pathogenesis-related leaf protein 4-like [Momordica charantia]